MTFKKAERSKAKLKIALTGPSGSGKTLSALILAKGIGKKIAVLDSENGSASLYADRFEFDTMEVAPPYTTKKYLDGIKAAESAGYDLLIIDSISHAWAGEGGILERKQAIDARGGNTYTNWKDLTPEQERFKSAILHSNIHIICTMRSKQDYVLQQNDKGRQSPVKVGLAPIQRDGMEYEFTTVFDIGMSHNAKTSKDRTGLFDDHDLRISEKTGEMFMKWLSDGKETSQAPASIKICPIHLTGHPDDAYTIDFGLYEGFCIPAVGEIKLKEYCKYVTDLANKKNKMPQENVVKFLNLSKKYLDSVAEKEVEAHDMDLSLEPKNDGIESK